eukprot:4750853-Amphidinium_carterae.1
MHVKIRVALFIDDIVLLGVELHYVIVSIMMHDSTWLDSPLHLAEKSPSSGCGGASYAASLCTSTVAEMRSLIEVLWPVLKCEAYLLSHDWEVPGHGDRGKRSCRKALQLQSQLIAKPPLLLCVVVVVVVVV